MDPRCVRTPNRALKTLLEGRPSSRAVHWVSFPALRSWIPWKSHCDSWVFCCVGRRITSGILQWRETRSDQLTLNKDGNEGLLKACSQEFRMENAVRPNSLWLYLEAVHHLGGDQISLSVCSLCHTFPGFSFVVVLASHPTAALDKTRPWFSPKLIPALFQVSIRNHSFSHWSPVCRFHTLQRERASSPRLGTYRDAGLPVQVQVPDVSPLAVPWCSVHFLFFSLHSWVCLSSST